MSLALKIAGSQRDCTPALTLDEFQQLPEIFRMQVREKSLTNRFIPKPFAAEYDLRLMLTCDFSKVRVLARVS